MDLENHILFTLLQHNNLTCWGAMKIVLHIFSAKYQTPDLQLNENRQLYMFELSFNP